MRMKKLKTAFFLIFISCVLQAQDNYMALSFGAGVPLGDYASTVSLSSDGFALNGFMAEYSGAYYLINYLGVGGAIKFNQSALNKEKIQDALLEVLTDGTLDSITQSNLGFWSIVSLGVGPQFSLPAGRFVFDFYFFPGMHIVTPPKLELTAIIDGNPEYTTVSSQKLRFGFETGASLQIHINETTGLRLSASYLETSSKGSVKGREQTNGSEIENAEFTRRILIVNASIGLVYIL